MVQFRPQTREVITKIVYYGPPLGGKTTNLRTLYDGYPPATRGELVVVPAGGDRTIFFDFLPVDAGTLRGMRMRVQLYTVPGQVHYNATRQVVLRGVDAVVFVADSQRELLRSNQESWANLKENLALQGLSLADVPHVLQYNKRDLSDILAVDELDQLLNEFNAPFFEAVSTTGIGVEETLQGVVKLVARSLRDRFKVLAEKDGAFAEQFGPRPLPDTPALEVPPVFSFPPAGSTPPAAREAPPEQVPEPAQDAEAPRTTVVAFAQPPAAVPDVAAMVFPPAQPAPAAAAMVFSHAAVTGGAVSDAEPLLPSAPAPLAAEPPALGFDDPFGEPVPAATVAGDDVFELPRPAGAVADTMGAGAAGAAARAVLEPDIVLALAGGDEVSSVAAEPLAGDSQGLVQRVVPRLLAQVGEVRELGLEVPVPAAWTGGKRLTLQLRLTLIPEEEAHAN